MTADKASGPDGLVDGVNSPFNACCYRESCRSQAATITRLRAELDEARGLLAGAHQAMLKPGGPTLGDASAIEAYLTRTEKRHE